MSALAAGRSVAKGWLKCGTTNKAFDFLKTQG
jgi:hypothetical protein